MNIPCLVEPFRIVEGTLLRIHRWFYQTEWENGLFQICLTGNHQRLIMTSQERLGVFSECALAFCATQSFVSGSFSFSVIVLTSLPKIYLFQGLKDLLS
jgi:hypothetical protein